MMLMIIALGRPESCRTLSWEKLEPKEYEIGLDSKPQIPILTLPRFGTVGTLFLVDSPKCDSAYSPGKYIVIHSSGGLVV